MSSSRALDLDVESPVFSPGFPIPRDYTADGTNTSPPLRWSDPPEGTASFALICDDPDAPRGTFTHWVLFNLPRDLRELPPGIPPNPDLSSGARQGTNDFGHIGYGGPAPPPGPPHRYFFKLYALDVRLGAPAGATRDQVLQAMRNHQLAEGRLFGVYGREKKGG
jgi:Raf kinase inhibitor-like YbhB/YbcL family protein